MVIKVGDKTVLTLTETQKKVIQFLISSEIFDSDMEGRVAYYPAHKYVQSYKALKAYWDPILTSEEIEIPADPDDYATLVFARKDYKDRAARDAENTEATGV